MKAPLPAGNPSVECWIKHEGNVTKFYFTYSETFSISLFCNFQASPCYGKGLNGPVLTERNFLERFPRLINNQENVDGICKFIPYYKHLNDLIEKWEARAEYEVHHSPSPCEKINPDSKFMLFGIKECFKDLNDNHNNF